MERRKSRRASVVLQARYAANNPTPAGGGKTITRDLSRSGTALVLEHRIAPNTVVEVELEIPGLEQAVKAKGEVMWQRNISGGLAPTFLTGVQFLRMDSPLQEQIERFVTSQLKQHSQTVDEKAVDSFDRDIRTVQQPWPIQMATLRTTHARVAAIGAYLPPTRLTNEDLVKKAGVSFLPILLQRALGASERRVAPPEDTAADLMVRAAKNILEQAHCDPKDLDRIICSSDPGDAVAPATAVAVQAKLAATCPAYDVTMSCAGWMCGIDQGLRALATGEKKILVLASAMATKTTFHDLKHRAIFGDGAGGLLLEAVPEGQLMATALWSDGRFYSKIFLPGHWAHHPADIPEEYKGSFYMDPNQNTFFDQLSRVLPPFFKRLLLEADVAVEDIDHFFLHQPSQPLFEHSLKLLRMIPRSKVYDAFSKYGNIVAAEMPVMLNEAVQNGQVKRGDLVCMVTYGAGFTMAGLVFQY